MYTISTNISLTFFRVTAANLMLVVLTLELVLIIAFIAVVELGFFLESVNVKCSFCVTRAKVS